MKGKILNNNKSKEEIGLNSEEQLDIINYYESLLNFDKKENFLKILLKKNPNIVAKIYQMSNISEEKEYIADLLIKHYKRLIYSIAKKSFNKFKDNPNIELEDLIQEGNIGFIKAIDNFDISKNTKLSTYATYWINQCVIKYIQDNAFTIRVPSHLYNRIIKINKIKKEYSNQGEENPTIDEIALKTNYSVQQIKEAIIFSSLLSKISLSQSIKNQYENGEEIKLEDLIIDNTYNPKNIYDERQIKAMILKSLSEILTETEFDIICRRYGIGKYKSPQKLSIVAEKYKLSKERIRQIQNQAESKIKGSPNFLYSIKD